MEYLHKKMLQHLSDLIIYEAYNTIIFQTPYRLDFYHQWVIAVSAFISIYNKQWQCTKPLHEKRWISWTDHHYGRKRRSKLQTSLEHVLLEQNMIQYKNNLFPCKSQKYVGIREVWIKWISFKMVKIKRWNWGTLLTSKKNR